MIAGAGVIDVAVNGAGQRRGQRMFVAAELRVILMEGGLTDVLALATTSTA